MLQVVPGTIAVTYTHTVTKNATTAVENCWAAQTFQAFLATSNLRGATNASTGLQELPVSFVYLTCRSPAALNIA